MIRTASANVTVTYHESANNQLHRICSNMAASTPRSDKILNEKWDVVISNGLVKTGLGFGVGVVASVLLRRRAWPVVFGTGFGAGIGWSEGDATFQSAYKETDAGKRFFRA